MSEPSERDELSLRLRGPESSDDAPRLDAFLPSRPGKRQRVVGAGRGLWLDDELEDLVQQLSSAPGLSAGHERLVPLFFRRERAPIPATEAAPARAQAWHLASTAEGNLAFLRASSKLDARRAARAVTVMATCVSLALPMGVAHAQAPAAGAPSPAAANDEVVDADEAESAPTSEVAPTAAPVVEGPAPQAQAPAVESGGMFPTLVNEDLVMSMRDGSTFHGRLLAVQEPWLICARLEDGRVVAVLRTEVAQVHALPPAQAGPRVIKQDTGAGRIGAGIAMVTGGGVMVIGGIWGGIYYGTAGYGAGAYVWLPLILPAALMIGVGIPLIVRGGKIQREFRGKLPRAYQAKLTKRRKVAWDGGLRLRF